MAWDLGSQPFGQTHGLGQPYEICPGCPEPLWAKPGGPRDNTNAAAEKLPPRATQGSCAGRDQGYPPCAPQFSSPGLYEACLYLPCPPGQLAAGQSQGCRQRRGRSVSLVTIRLLAGDFANHRASAAQLGHGALQMISPVTANRRGRATIVRLRKLRSRPSPLAGCAISGQTEIPSRPTAPGS